MRNRSIAIALTLLGAGIITATAAAAVRQANIADFRLRFGEFLPLSVCQYESHVAGRFKVRALPTHGGAPCHGFVGAGFDGCNGNTQCTSSGALAGGWFELFSGFYKMVPDPVSGAPVCSAFLPADQRVWERIQWAPSAGRGAGAGGADFQAWFLHEAGHAFGFGHEDAHPMTTFAVMKTVGTGSNISIDEAIGLRGVVGPIQLSPKISSVSVSAPSHWTHFYAPPVMASVYADSQTAEVIRMEAGTGAVSPTSQHIQPHGYASPLRSFRSPAYATRPEGNTMSGPSGYTVEVIAVQSAQDASGAMTYSHNLHTYYSYDGKWWQEGTILDAATTMEPVLVYKEEHNLFLLFWVDTHSLEIKLATSADGINFVPRPLIRSPDSAPMLTSQSFGVDCHPTTDKCLLVYSDAARHHDIIKVAELNLVWVTGIPPYPGHWVVHVTADDDLLTADAKHWHSYGVDVAYVLGTYFYVIAWRDRGRASALQMATFEVSGSREAVHHLVDGTIHQSPRLTRRGQDIFLSHHFNWRYDQ